MIQLGLFIFWVSWIGFLIVMSLGVNFFLFFIKPKSINFELEETVCGTMHQKGFLSDADYEFEERLSEEQSENNLIGYKAIILPIIGILKRYTIIDNITNFFTQRWVKSAQAKDNKSQRILKVTGMIGDAILRLVSVFERIPPRLSGLFPLASLLGVFLVNLFIVEPHYLVHLTLGLYGFLYLEIVSFFTKDNTSKFSDLSMTLTVLTYISVFFMFLYKCLFMPWYSVISAALVFGFIGGSIGFSLGHELCHSTNKLLRVLSKVVFGTLGYPQFYESHLKMHHPNLLKEEDVSSTTDKSFFQFMKGQIINYIKKVDLGLLVTVVFLLPTVLYPKVLCFYLISFIVSFTLLQGINYIQHYGLKRTSDKLEEHYSWDTKAFSTNAFLFNLGCHGHHHKSPRTKCSDLKFKSKYSRKEGYLLQLLEISGRLV